MARALLEGIALEVRRCMRVLDDAGVTAGPLVVAGGAAGSDLVAELLAGATGASITRIEDGRWISARGAAIVAAIERRRDRRRTGHAAPGEGDVRAARRRRRDVGRARRAPR